MSFNTMYKQYLPELSESMWKNMNQYFDKLKTDGVLKGLVGEAESEEVLWLRHILDSLLVLSIGEVSHLFNEKKQVVYDLGTGAGLPGIPLAICFPENHFYLNDTSLKRTMFLQEVINDLHLVNVTVLHSRIEDLNKEKLTSPDIVLFRAFQKPLVSLELALYVLKKKGKVLYWRSKRFDVFQEELSDKQHIEKIQKKIQNLGYEEIKFFHMESPNILGPRGIYLFSYSGKNMHGFPREWIKIKRDEFILQVS